MEMKILDIQGINDHFTHLFMLQIFLEDLLCAGSPGFHGVGASTLLELPLHSSVLELYINGIVPHIL